MTHRQCKVCGHGVFNSEYRYTCCHENLYELPILSTKLQYLNCNNNNLVGLPELSRTLDSLYCCNNKLVELPELPESLKWLICSDNNLIGLPELPRILNYLNCSCNNIKYLSYHNCQIIKNDNILVAILTNPISNGFYCDQDFINSLV